MAIKAYSTTAASNNLAPPNGAPEGWALADINNWGRQVMADVRFLASQATVASAATTDLGANDNTFLTISGTTTITSFGTVSAGMYKFLTFSGALILTHNAASLILPGGENIVTIAGASAIAVSNGAGAWKVLFYQSMNQNFATGRNLIMNGGMRIAQRGTSFAAAANGYTLDRWQYAKVGTMVHTISQDTDVPTVAQSGVLFNNSLRLNLTTADTAIAAADFTQLTQTIEGYDFQRIAQRAFTASFWVKATTAGVYSIAFRNSGVDRSYVANFTIAASATWELKTINVPASPSAGTWNYTSGAGMTVSFSLAVGATFQTTAGAWQTGNFLGTATNINGVNTGATDFKITGVEVEPGSVATEFEMESIEAELSKCQRYFWKSFPYATAPAQNAGQAGAISYRVSAAGAITASRSVTFPVIMRTTPTFITYNPLAANANWRSISTAADSGTPSTSAGSGSDSQVEISNNQVAGDLVGHFIIIHATADAEL